MTSINNRPSGLSAADSKNIQAKKLDALDNKVAGADAEKKDALNDAVVAKKKDEADLSGAQAPDREADAIDAVVAKKKDASAGDLLDVPEVSGTVSQGPSMTTIGAVAGGVPGAIAGAIANHFIGGS